MALNDRPVEIFAPFGEAFELTKKILFQPFDLAKWFVIGFAAWLATFFSGGGGWNARHYFQQGDWHWRARHQGQPFSLHDIPPWVIPVGIIGLLFVLALFALVLWLNARGRFIFTDCIVRNRAAIVAPWHEYRREADQYFVFNFVVTLCGVILFGGLAFVFFVGSYWGDSVMPFALLIALGACWVLLAILFQLLTRFMVPVMYRQRCSAMAALRAVWGLITADPANFILFALFYLLLYVAAMVIACVAGCVTCCIAALPYIGTVILLPVVMVLYAFPLFFLRQFGDPYDVWAGVAPAELPPAPPIPPVQEPPPPPAS